MNAEELLGLVRILDDAMNNTSLILLLQIGETPGRPTAAMASTRSCSPPPATWSRN